MTRIRIATFLGNLGIETFNREMAEYRERAVSLVMADAVVLPSDFAKASNRFRKIVIAQTAVIR